MPQSLNFQLGLGKHRNVEKLKVHAGELVKAITGNLQKASTCV